MTHWPSPAKLNLFLYITGRRASDNYHNLQTLFQFLDYCDYLSFTIRSDNQINLLTPVANVPNDSNLIIIAAKTLQNYAHSNDQVLGVDISIDKRLPMGGGLGGASSNAATVLVALNKLWNLNISTDDLIALGRTLGADIPIFVYGHSAFAEGIGDKFQCINIPERWFVVAQPNVEISTAKVFSDSELKRDTVIRSLSDLLKAPFQNDCEYIVCKKYPAVEYVIKQLSKYAPARLTGTGSCVFAEFDSKELALQAQHHLPSKIFSFVAKGQNISPLKRLLTD